MLYINRNQDQQVLNSQAYINLIKESRLGMAQLAYMTREYLVAVFSGFGNAEAIANRLYSLPSQLHEKTELIFGAPASEELTHLLSMHVAYIRSLANALLIGDQAAADYSVQQLYQNTDAIAALYAKINPFWSETQMKTLFYNYDSLLIQDAVALASHDFEKDMDIFDRMIFSAMLMGDYHADGLLQYIMATGQNHAGESDASRVKW